MPHTSTVHPSYAVATNGGSLEPNRRTDAGGLRIHLDSREALKGQRRLHLSPRAFSLLEFLAANPGRVFSRQTLLDRVWGPDCSVTERTVDVHVRWIRQQIEDVPSNPVLLLTVRGLGYKYRPSE